MTINTETQCIPRSLLTGMPLGVKQGPEHITQMEAMRILRMLWSKQHQVMNLLMGGLSNGKEGYKCFFYEVVPVLPNKYRPCSYSDGRRWRSFLLYHMPFER